MSIHQMKLLRRGALMPKQTPDHPGQGGNATQRGCSYCRVSTGRQVEGELSIPDQLKQIAQFYHHRRWELIENYVEGGATATDDNRPEFQRMIERALDDDRPYDVIVVHSFSRFFRDSFQLELYVRKLAKAGVRLVSVTQELGEDPQHAMFRQFIAIFDEYQSRENGKHVLRAMKENASQGFYNGSPVPLGYRAEEVERRGARIKKHLVVDPVEAETIKLIYRLYVEGDAKAGPIGIKQISGWLNDRGYRTKRGGLFGVSAVHTILTNRTYVGETTFNKRCSKTLRDKPERERVQIAVPAIIEPLLFENVQQTLRERNPRSVAPRVVTGPILLTGLAVCSSCGGAMTLRTGTSRSGQIHKYYACSTCARKGKSACAGRSIRMDKLDSLVTNHLVERLFRPERLEELLSSVLAQRREREAEVDARASALHAEIADKGEKLRRLYRLVEDSEEEPDDIFKARVAQLKQDRDRAITASARIEANRSSQSVCDPAQIEMFTRLMRANITSGEVPFRKAYIRAVVERIEVGADIIRIIGSRATLGHAVSKSEHLPAGVRSSVPKWRARKDSNL